MASRSMSTSATWKQRDTTPNEDQRDEVGVVDGERDEAMTAGRGVVRVTPQEALAKVAEGSGTEFDPAVVEALGRAVRDGGLELNLPDLAFPAMAAPLP